MRLEPRWYQKDAVMALIDFIHNRPGRHPIIALPTGTGKSVVIALFLEWLHHAYPQAKALCATHIDILVDQNHKKLVGTWPLAPAGIYSAGLKLRESWNKFTFCGIQSTFKLGATFGKVSVLLIDECHMLSPQQTSMYATLIRDLREVNPHLIVIGLSATPWRMSGGLLTDCGLFTDIAYDLTDLESFNRLFAEGWLVPPIPCETDIQMDTSSLPVIAGEFKQSAVEDLASEELLANALEEGLRITSSRNQGIIYAPGIKSVEFVSEYMSGLGLECPAIHSRNKKEVNLQTLQDFRDGRYRHVVNNVILTTGLDHPPLDFMIILVPTASSIRWVQILGRGTRPCPSIGKKNCLVADFAGNARRLGPINDPVIPKKRGKRKGGGGAPIKTCPAPGCRAINHASARYCLMCGYEFPFDVKINTEASTDELVRGMREEPIVETYDVELVSYSKHVKHNAKDKPPVLKVVYYCNNHTSRFFDWVCLQHDGYPARKARDWWRQRSSSAPPVTVDAALLQAQSLRRPTQLRVWINTDYPSILDYCWDGTSFGDHTIPDSYEGPEMEVIGVDREVTATRYVVADDEVPF